MVSPSGRGGAGGNQPYCSVAARLLDDDVHSLLAVSEVQHDLQKQTPQAVYLSEMVTGKP